MSNSRRRPALHEIYERELAFLHKEAHEFAERHGDRARGLLLEPHRCNDPHIERLIDACAMLAARVNLRLNDGFGEIADGMLDVLYPHYLAPLPPFTIVQYQLGSGQGQQRGGVLIDRGTPLLTRLRVKGYPMRFRSCYKTRMYPVAIEEVELASATPQSLGLSRVQDVAGVLRIVLRSTGGLPIADLGIDDLRFYLEGEASLTHPLYELLLCHSVGLAAKNEKGRVELLSVGRDEQSGIKSVGFDENESLLDYRESAQNGYRVVQEYFAFAEKFLFVSMAGLSRAPMAATDESMELSVLLDHYDSELGDRIRFRSDPSRPTVRAALQLGCTPAVNLFRHRAEPIRLSHQTDEYPVIPEARARELFEVHHVDEVSTTVIGSGDERKFRPIYSLGHGGPPTEKVGFWHTRRQAFGDSGTDVFLTLVDRAFDMQVPAGIEVVHVTVTCSNRDALTDAKFAGDATDLQIEGRPEIDGAAVLRHPSPAVRSGIDTPVDSRATESSSRSDGSPRSESRWRLVSHLTLNHLSLAPPSDPENRESVERASAAAMRTLQEILRLYDPLDSKNHARQIDGVTGLRSRHVTRVIPSVGPVRGLAIEVEIDPSCYPGESGFLFASVLNRFFALHGSLNSFTETSVRAAKSDRNLKQWPPRTGERPLI